MRLRSVILHIWRTSETAIIGFFDSTFQVLAEGDHFLCVKLVRPDMKL
jgi:hypothetical protein